jgi:hypothetical protein
LPLDMLSSSAYYFGVVSGMPDTNQNRIISGENIPGLGDGQSFTGVVRWTRQGKTESVARSVSLKSLKRKGINVQGNVWASAEVTVILAPTSFAESAIGQGRAEFGERVPA